MLAQRQYPAPIRNVEQHRKRSAKLAALTNEWGRRYVYSQLFVILFDRYSREGFREGSMSSIRCCGDAQLEEGCDVSPMMTSARSPYNKCWGFKDPQQQRRDERASVAAGAISGRGEAETEEASLPVADVIRALTSPHFWFPLSTCRSPPQQ